MAATTDGVMRQTLERGPLTSLPVAQGILPAGGASARSVGETTLAEVVEQMAATLLAHVKSNPGQRGEQIAEVLGVDTKQLRLPMQKLIDEASVKTKGQRRGMRYYPA